MKKATIDICNSRMLAGINALVPAMALLGNMEPTSGALKPGDIYLANEARFVEANFSEPLTTYAVGWKDPQKIEDTLEFFAPAVTVSERFEYAEFTNAEEFLADQNDDDIRAIGADFKRIDYTGKKTLGKTLNKGLTTRVDLDQVKGQPNWQEFRTGKMMRRLYRNELIRAITLLAGAATNTAKTWSSGTPNPDADARAALLAASTSSGIRPNRVGYGDTAWDLRQSAFEAANNPAGYAGAMRDVTRLPGYLNVDGVLVSRERYQTSASTKAEIVAGLVLLFNAMSGADTEDASNIKRFVSPVGEGDNAGGNFRVYVQQVNAKMVDITVEHRSVITITSTLGIRKLTIS